MAITDIVKRNGNGKNGHTNENTNLTVQREQTDNWLPAPTSFFQDPDAWMRRWDQMFDSFFNRSLGKWGMQPGASTWGSFNSFTPAINVAETDSEYRVTAELPGMDERDIELSLHRDHLTIKGEKKQEHEDSGKGYYRMERSYGTFQRTLPLPAEVDPEKVEAAFNKGVLTITLPKLPEQQSGARKISIKREGK